METHKPSTRPTPASDELVEYVAAAFHTLVRSWHYDLDLHASDGPRRGPVPLDAWIEPVRDPEWIARGRPTVDVANTWWGDLPADWRRTFREIASVAAGEVIRAVEEGRTALELLDDAAFVGRTASLLPRPWLTPPRVIVDGTPAPRAPGAAEAILAETAIHVYGARLAGPHASGGAGLGSVPRLPLPDRSAGIAVGGRASRDDKFVSFTVMGDQLDPDLLSGLLGTVPDRAHRMNDMNISWRTGQPYAPFRSGLWSITSEGELDRRDTVLEDHVGWLLSVIEPHRDELRELMRVLGFEARFFCFYTPFSWNAGWGLSAATIGRIAAIGASFEVDRSRGGGDEPDAT